MINDYHLFHIPVMGTGYTANTPIYVAPFGISSSISLVDDILLKRLQRYYAKEYNISNISYPDGGSNRAERVTAYLDTVQQIVSKKLQQIKQLSFFEVNDKQKYFKLLPDTSNLKKDFLRLLKMDSNNERETLEKELNAKIKTGSIDVNIMVKLDRMPLDANQEPLGQDYTDAKTALKGFADSSVEGNMIFSAGINQSLFTYMTQFGDFYQNELGKTRKKIILKVSDFRSAMIQGKFLAKKGIEIYEFRIESGLNCGGHTFPSKGITLFSVLKEFTEKRNELSNTFSPLIKKYYEKNNMSFKEECLNEKPLLTVQGGIGTPGEHQRLIDDFNVDSVGWGTPFLFVPEVVQLDDTTLELLKKGTEKDYYLSDASPIGVPFSNIHNTGSDFSRRQLIKDGNSGSPCPKGFLASNTEFTDIPICTGGRKYQKLKLQQIEKLDVSEKEKNKLKEKVLCKECICHYLGSSVLIKTGIVKEDKNPQCICPGPNAAWINESYSLKEMIDYIYNRSESIVSSEREHMFVKEIDVYIEYTEKLINECDGSKRAIKDIQDTILNLKQGIAETLNFAQNATAYPKENISSIETFMKKSQAKLDSLKIL